MPTYSDTAVISASTAEAVATLRLPVGAKIVELACSFMSSTGHVPTQVRVEYAGIKTPQKYCTGLTAAFATSGAAHGRCLIPVDIDVLAGDVTVGVIATGSVSVTVGVKYIA